MSNHLWLVAWMRRILRERDWSAEEWARRAEVAGTTITRFLSDPDGTLPSVRTLTKLASAAGVLFPAPPSPSSRFTFVPLLDARSLASGGTMDDAAVGDVEIPARFGHCRAIVCGRTSGGMVGILPGDTLVFDPAQPGGDGALVVAVWPDGTAGPLRVVGDTLREEAPGAALHARANVTVLGLVVHMHRDLPQG